MAITHLFASTQADSTDSTLIRPSNWNANHTGTLGTSQGGLGVANSTDWSLTTTSTGATGFKLTAFTTVTFPSSGTLAVTAATSFANLDTVGTITTGTWSATTISASKGGTGVANNAASTIAINGSFALGLTISAASTVTLPTSGTLLTQATIGTLASSQGGTATANTSGASLTLSSGGVTSIKVTANTTVTLPTSGTLIGTDATATIATGYTITPFNLNTISTAFTPNAANGNYQYGTLSTAANIWSVPGSDSAIDILTTNSSNGGATIATSGYTVGTSVGDAQSTSSGAKHIISIRRINAISTYVIKALQ